MFVHLLAGRENRVVFCPQKTAKLKVPRLFGIHKSPRRRRRRQLQFESLLELGGRFSYVPTFISHCSPSCGCHKVSGIDL